MKKLMVLALMLVVFLVPFVAFAEGEEGEGDATLIATDQRVIVYFFHGDGCPHCAEAEEWFDSIQGEYGEKMRIAAYEVWNDAENASLMSQVAQLRGDDATGGPYIVIGDKWWIGFNETVMGSEIKAQIDAMYEIDPAERVDSIADAGGVLPPEAEKSDKKDGAAKDVIALIVVLVITGGICYGVYAARKSAN